MSKKAMNEQVTGITLRYAKASWKEKGIILEEAVKDTGYTGSISSTRLAGWRSLSHATI